MTFVAPDAPRRVFSPGPDWALVAGLTLVGLWLRLYALDVVGLWWDEFVTLGRASWPLRDMLPSLAFEGPSDVSLDSSPPLFHLLVHASLIFFPATDWAVKLPSVIAGTLTIPVVWLLGRRLFSKTTAMAAATLCALSLFHIHYSREARPYALYLLFALLGLYFLSRALAATGRRRDWIGFALANILMFYASYLAAATFFAEGLIVAARAALLWRSERRAALRLLASAALCALAVFAAYLPWLPAHIFQVRTIHADGPTGNRFDSAGFLSVLKAFAAAYYQGGAPWPAFLAVLAGVGLVRHIAMGRLRALCALGLWALCALAMAAVLPTQIHVSIRYLVNIFFLYVYLAAGGIEAVCALFRRLSAKSVTALAMLLAAACSMPTFETLPIYAKRDSPSIKSVLADLLVAKNNVDWLFYYRNRHLKIISDWYLRGAFRTAASLPDRRYRRFFLLTPDDLVHKRAIPGLVPVAKTFWADSAKGGVVNRSPLPLDVPYAADFTDLSFFADVYTADNMAPDLGYGTLALYDCRIPGRAVFAFVAPPGMRREKTRATVDFALRPGKASLPESTASVTVGTDPDALVTAATVRATDFAPGTTHYSRTVDLPAPDPATGLVYIALGLDPGHVDGALEFAGLRLAPPAAPPTLAIKPVWERRATAIAANTRVLPGLDGAAVLGGETLFGFADAARPDLSLGGPEALAAYLAAYPDDTPVATLADAAGNIRARYFDPGLRHPFTAVTSRPRPVLPGFGQAMTAKGFVASGNIAGQTVSVGQERVRLPVAAPAGSKLLLDVGGTGLVHFSPGFDAPLSALLSQALLAHAVVAVPGSPALTCAGDAPCFLTYAVTAAPGATPITGFRLAWYPRVLTDGTGHNSLTATYSTDGATYQTLGTLRSAGDFFWYGGKMRMAREVRLPHPAKKLYVRFALSGGGAQLWSAPETRLSLDVRLAGTDFSGLPLPANAVPAQSDGPDGCAVLPTREPPPLGWPLRERM
ncbi:glycosyltransferase family 39 protein [Desulfovibrio sp. JY]|nr:glycosyltransferase family 39 protein [Desulfovibrio sp. JY]